jgi:hypothetical protein
MVVDPVRGEMFIATRDKESHPTPFGGAEFKLTGTV